MKTVELAHIDVAYPDLDDLHVRVFLAAGRLRLMPGAAQAWATGTYRDPSGRLPCQVMQNGSRLEVVQSEHPHFFSLAAALEDPELELTLGTARPFSLEVETRVGSAHCDLGGLPVTALALRHDAGDAELDFQSASTQPMSNLHVTAGAANLVLRNLGNANCAELALKADAGAATLDFGGALRQAMSARIIGAACSVELRIPAGLAARVTGESMVLTVEADHGFARRDGAFWSQAALAQVSPLLTAAVDVKVGTLRLITI